MTAADAAIDIIAAVIKDGRLEHSNKVLGVALGTLDTATNMQISVVCRGGDLRGRGS